MKKVISYLLLFIVAFFVVGCFGPSGSESTKDGSISGDKVTVTDGPIKYFGDLFSSDDKKISASAIDIYGKEDIYRPGLPEFYKSFESPIYYEFETSAGQLTASVLFDNDDYSYFRSLITTNQDENGKFKEYHDKFKFINEQRFTFTIKDVKNAKVEFVDENYTTTSNYNGQVYYFPKEVKPEYNVKVTYLNANEEIKVLETKVTNNQEITIDDESIRKDVIELMFVVDTTGSMGDELSFLQKEIEDVINDVQEKNPNSTILLALLFYRDFGDEYVVKYFDFNKNIKEQQEVLLKQSHQGGGDMPEAVQEAFKVASEAQWSYLTSTKLLFHIADAPSHDEDVSTWKKYVDVLNKIGVKIISVASSGINKMTEYCYRAQSMLTGGAYVYLTDDSGIGNSHLVADFREKPPVEYLNALLKRLINGYHNGDFGEAVPYDGGVQPGTMPEEMPEDFTFNIKWGENLSYEFDLSTKVLKYNDVNKEIELTEEQIKAFYNSLNSLDVTKVKSEDPTTFKKGVKLSISFSGQTIDVCFGPSKEYAITKLDYAFYQLMESIIAVLINI